MPPLLQRLSERQPEESGLPRGLIWIDSSTTTVGCCIFSPFSLCPWIGRFWKRAGYTPLYIRQTPSELTGEHTCVMVRGLNSSIENDIGWLAEFAGGMDFLLVISYRS
jgi:N-acetyltransferase 10